MGDTVQPKLDRRAEADRPVASIQAPSSLCHWVGLQATLEFLENHPVAQSFECPTLDFSLGYDLGVVRLASASILSGESA